jgi:hypothetical protein
MMRSSIALLAILSVATGAPVCAQQAPSNAGQMKQPAPNSNEKICEDVTEPGSRVVTKRFCGTRAEWEERKRQDREGVEQIQRPMQCPVMGGHHC